MNKYHIVIGVVAFVALVAALASPAEAGWGRYRVSTYYGTPSVPVVQETVVVRGAFRPVLVGSAPITAYYGAPLLIAPAPVTAYYAAPAVIVPGPRRAIRAAYYAPAPATYYYDAYLPGTVILP